jgi:hypothetical protein
MPSVTGDEATISAWVEARLEAIGHGEILRSGHSLVWRGPQSGRPLVVLAGKHAGIDHRLVLLEGDVRGGAHG